MAELLPRKGRGSGPTPTSLDMESQKSRIFQVQGGIHHEHSSLLLTGRSRSLPCRDHRVSQGSWDQYYGTKRIIPRHIVTLSRGNSNIARFHEVLPIQVATGIVGMYVMLSAFVGCLQLYMHTIAFRNRLGYSPGPSTTAVFLSMYDI